MNGPDIDLLAKRVTDLSASVDFWNAVMLWGLALAAFAALVIGWSTRRVVVISGQLSTAQTDLSNAKEGQLQGDLRVKDGKIAEALKQAGASNERAAKLERENIRLEQQIALTGNRNLVILAAQDDIAQELRKFAGQEFEMASSDNEFTDTEILGTRAAIGGTLSPAALWKELPSRQLGAWAQAIIVFCRKDSGENTKLAAKKLTFELDKTLGKRSVGKLQVGFVGAGEVDPNGPPNDMLPSGKDVILIFVGPHI